MPWPRSRCPTAGAGIIFVDLLERGPLVLSFYRGGWCPYCVTEMTAWAEAAPAVRDLGASFIGGYR